MNHCKNCKHWSIWPSNKEFGLCMYFPTHKVDDTTIMPAKPLDDIIPQDLGFTTGQNFGCIKFENEKLN